MELKECLGFGVAGNFAGHLEQANEASDFENVKTFDALQPKAIFPFYLPGKKDSFLSVFPISSNTIKMPETSYGVQIEPEVALICEVEYQGDKVKSLTPKTFCAYNDCSIRRPGAKKISEKKNWGESSKGLSLDFIKVDTFSKGGILDQYRIASFHIRNGLTYAYGEDSEVLSYSYFHEKLIDWCIDRFNNQNDEGPAENIKNYILECNKPKYFILGIGATRYTKYGEENFLQAGDTSVVILYDKRKYSIDSIKEKIDQRDFKGEGLSVLVQEVI